MKSHLLLRIIGIFLFHGLCLACNSSSNASQHKTAKQDEREKNNKQHPTTIYLIPLGNVNASTSQFVQRSVKSFYGFECIIKKQEPLAKSLLAKSNTRYEATAILNAYKSNENILLLTEFDIAYHKSDTYPEWGIFGLGFRPGSTCVVSTFRLKKGVSQSKFLERLQKVCIHEIGHNLGLSHCTASPICLMNDANGTIKQVDKEQLIFCESCKHKIGMK
jgi:archaemetzincin